MCLRQRIHLHGRLGWQLRQEFIIEISGVACRLRLWDKGRLNFLCNKFCEIDPSEPRMLFNLISAPTIATDSLFRLHFIATE
jgi:hypothetical protein